MAIVDGWDKIIKDAIDNTTHNIIERIEEDIEHEAPEFTGTYKRAVIAEVKTIGNQLTGRIGNTVEYAEKIEYGADRIEVDRAVIEDWARKKFGLSGRREISRAGYLIQKKLRESGLEGKKVFQNAWVRNQSYINEQVQKLQKLIINSINSTNNKEVIKI